MKRARIALLGAGLLAAVTFMLASANSADAQGIYVGPGGISFGSRVGSYYLPFNNGGAFYNRGGYYGGRYGARGYAGRSGLYWAPGMYWTPRDYWYGDLGWPRFNSMLSGNGNTSTGGLAYYDQFSNRANLPPLPQFEELQRMNWTHLRRVLAFGASQLEQGLDRVATGSKWTGYLRIDRLQEIAANQANVPPTREEADELQAVLKKFDQAADDDQYRAISGLWGFEVVRRVVAEFVQNPAVRYRQQLVKNSNDLERALDRFGTGATWQQYFSLPTDVFVDPADAATVKSPPDPEALRKALVKFDDVAKNPAYRIIADLPAFVAAHASLARYLGREMPAESPVAADSQTPNPPADPALSESGEVNVTPQADPFRPAEKGAAPAEEKPGTVPAKKAPPKQVEELFAPTDDAPAKAAPAVREKE